MDNAEQFKEVNLDERSLELLAPVKAAFEVAWDAVQTIPPSQAKETALGYLQNSYFWVNKAIANNQVWRLGSQANVVNVPGPVVEPT